MASTIPTNEVTQSGQRRLWLWLLLALVGGLFLGWAGIQLWARFGPAQFNGLVMQSPQPLDNFTLTAHTGERLSLRDLRGEVVLLYFGYTYCPDACPATLATLKEARDSLGRDGEGVRVVLVSVDPDRDTPAVLAEYLGRFDPSFIGLTGSESELLAATTPLGIFFASQGDGSSESYLVDHTASVAAIDRDGYLRLIYPFSTPADDIAADMRYLLRE